jgi:hypothetical protein
MFMLDKWYLDVVTGGGDAAILYVARLRWGAIRVGYASAIESASSGTHREARTIRDIDSPRRHGDAFIWQNRVLDVAGEWRRDAAPIRRTLASTADGVIRWSCQIPRACASVRIGERTYDGLGYAERLRLTMPPSRLPFDALRWGRHLSDRHALIWIDWRGAGRGSWVWLDGEAQPDAVVTDDGVSGLAGGAELRMDGGRDVVDRNVVSAFADLLPALTHHVVGRLASMHEHKRVERSAIVRAGVPLDDGWTLRELVTW